MREPMYTLLPDSQGKLSPKRQTAELKAVGDMGSLWCDSTMAVHDRFAAILAALKDFFLLKVGIQCRQWELEGCWFRLLALLVILLGTVCKEIFGITWSLSLSAQLQLPCFWLQFFIWYMKSRDFNFWGGGMWGVGQVERTSLWWQQGIIIQV